jgi:hypothetical protein
MARHAARTARPDPARSGDRQCHRRRRLRHPQVPPLRGLTRPHQGPRSPFAPSPPGVPWRSFHPARTPKRGNPTPPEQSHATRYCGHRSASGGPSGHHRAAMTAEAAQMPRCTEKNCWGSACPPGTSTVRSRSSRCTLPSRTASPRSAHLSEITRFMRLRTEEVRHLPLCETEPIDHLCVAGKVLCAQGDTLPDASGGSLSRSSSTPATPGLRGLVRPRGQYPAFDGIWRVDGRLRRLDAMSPPCA